MMPATLPQFDPQRLFRRLARVRRRLRVVAGLHGAFALIAVVVGGAAIVGWLDWRFQLPNLVRAMALVGIVAAAGVVVLRRLILPFREPTDNLRLALRLEDKNPELNDALASAIEFLEQPPDDESSSPLMRKVTVRRAARLAADCDFGELISVRGLFWSTVGAMFALSIAVPAALRAPAATETALTRLLAPFGVGEWPANTRIRVTAPAAFPYRHALGEGLEIRAEIDGFVPERATLSILFEGVPTIDQTWVVEREEESATGVLVARLEASKVQRSFKFRIKAYDGTTPWYEVQVLPPPEFVPLDGRPSPQIRLEYPAYTDLAPRQMPDGGGSFEAVAGTNVTLRAAVNRPVARAWIVYRPEQPVLTTSAALLQLATAAPMEAIASTAASRTVWERVPVALGRDGTLLEVKFTPRLAGVYALRFEDETGFGATRLIDARVLPDPAPTVTLDRPSATHDSLHVTLKAVLPLKSSITDSMFAVRSVWLESRTAKDGPVAKQPRFDHGIAGRSIAALAPPAPPVRLRLPSVRIDHRLRIEDLRHPDGQPLKEGDAVIIQMLADDFDDVTGDKAPGRSHEVELRIVSPATLEAMLQQEQANVRQNLLRVQQWQKEAREKVADAKVQKDATGKLRSEDLEKLLQAEQLQQQIRARIGDDKEGLRAEVNRIRQAQKDNQLPPSASQARMDAVSNELDRLAREELEPIEPLLNAARESDPSGAPKSDPMKLDPTRPDPTKTDPSKADPSKPNPMKSDPMKSDPMKADAAKTDPSKLKPAAEDRRNEPLNEALKHQREVEQTIEQLLQRLEPWSGANEVRGETRALLNEQEKLGQQTEALDQQMPKGSRERLQDQERADLDRAAARQETLGEQLKQLMEKMDRLATEKQAQERERLQQAEQLEAKAQERERLAEQSKGADREKDLRVEAQKLREQAQEQRSAAQDSRKEADALKDAAKLARDELNQDSGAATPQTKLHDAAKEMKENKLGNARQQQRESAKSLQKMLDRLEEKRSDDLDRLAKKMRDAEQKLDDLVDGQERLQKKVKAAQNISNPEQRRQELEKLAREQEQLREQAKDVLEELSRLKADTAAQTLSRASRGMEDAQQRLERGEKADGSQDEVLDKLDQVQDQLERSRQQVEEELLREKVEKATARVQALRDRQAKLNSEAKRIHDKAAKAGKWEDAALSSLAGLMDAQRGLAGEATSLIDHHFKPIKVAAKILEQSADAMRLAADRIGARHKDIQDRPINDPFDDAFEKKPQADIVKWQEIALRRLDQFLDALKPDKELKPSGGGGPMGGGGGGGPMGGGGRRPGGEEIPMLAQLKALRALQAEINERTAEFARQHPDPSKLDEPERMELELIRKMQRDVAELIREYNIPEEPNEGGRP